MLAMATGRPLWGQTTIIASPSWPRTTLRHRMTGTGVSGVFASASGSTSYQLTDFSIASLIFFGSSGSSLLGGCAPRVAGTATDATRQHSTTPARVRSALAALIAAPPWTAFDLVTPLDRERSRSAGRSLAAILPGRRAV